MLRSEIDYTIKSTIDHYKGEIFRLNSENEKLREDLDALEQWEFIMFVRLENSRSEGVGLLSRRFLFTTGVEVS
jgi:hypothetical protein